MTPLERFVGRSIRYALNISLTLWSFIFLGASVKLKLTLIICGLPLPLLEPLLWLVFLLYGYFSRFFLCLLLGMTFFLAAWHWKAFSVMSRLGVLILFCLQITLRRIMKRGNDINCFHFSLAAVRAKIYIIAQAGQQMIHVCNIGLFRVGYVEQLSTKDELLFSLTVDEKSIVSNSPKSAGQYMC